MGMLSSSIYPSSSSDEEPSRMLWCGQGNGKIQCFNLKVPEGRERMSTGIEIKPGTD